jgi:DNA-binding NtrC family response regulator
METKRKFFLIDDDIDDQEIFLMALKAVNTNIACVTVDDSIEGLRMLREDTSFIPDYIFIDVNIPKMNGMQCLPELKKINHLKDVELIMFSTSSDPRNIDESKVLGASQFMIKPSSLQELIEALRNLIKQ